jgi:hypothetical protein
MADAGSDPPGEAPGPALAASPPAAEELAATAAPAPVPEPPSFPVSRISFGGRSNVPVLLQNENGPCPLLALVNVLLLRGAVELGAGATEVSQV